MDAVRACGDRVRLVRHRPAEKTARIVKPIFKRKTHKNGKLIQRYFPKPLSEMEEKIADAIGPFLRRRTCSESMEEKAEGILKMAKSQFICRIRLFDTMLHLGYEPADAANTALNEVIPDFIPKRTISEAQELFVENRRLLGLALRKAGINNPELSYGDKEAMVSKNMFETALYLDEEKSTYSTYALKRVRTCRNEGKKLGHISFPPRIIGQIDKMLSLKEKEPGISRKKLAKCLEVKPSGLDKLERWARMRNPHSAVDGNALFYSKGDEDDTRPTALSNPADEKTTALSPEKMLVRNEEKKKRKELVKKALRTLPPQEEKVLRMRFGFNLEGKGKTLRECGEEIGTGREWIRQLEKRALKKLRHPSCSKLLKELLDF